ncbi:MAG: hypothetical protein MUQ13_11365 [Loktanella sp.]|nr:hypothetical protein [Loktanella sp.]
MCFRQAFGFCVALVPRHAIDAFKAALRCFGDYRGNTLFEAFRPSDAQWIPTGMPTGQALTAKMS